MHHGWTWLSFRRTKVYNLRYVVSCANASALEILGAHIETQEGNHYLLDILKDSLEDENFGRDNPID